MTARQYIQIDPETLEAVAFKHHLPIERSADEQRVYVTVDGLTFYAPSLDVAS